MSFEDKKAYIKQYICSFLVKRAVVAYGREAGALGRLFKPHSGSQPRLSPFLQSEMTVLRYFGVLLACSYTHLRSADQEVATELIQGFDLKINGFSSS